MVKQRHLADLYRVAKEHTADDGRGPVTVWLQKLNGTEMELARRKADAARARVLSLRSAPDSDEYLAAAGEAFEFTDKDYLVGQLLQPARVKRREVRQAEVAFADEWSEDNYLQGLRDAWFGSREPGAAGGLSETFVVDPEDPEAKRVFDELSRFEAQVKERIETDLAEERAELESLDVAELQQRLAEENLKAAADLAWMAEYRKCVVWFAVRKIDKHDRRYFETRPEVDELQDETFLDLYTAVSELTVDPHEGKDSPETPDSSQSSAPPDEEATDESPGLVAVAQ